jgi:hypothetical protein
MHRLLTAILTSLTLAAGAVAADADETAVDTAITGLAAVPTGLVFGAGELREPIGLDVDVRGFLYVADAMAGKVFRYDPDGSSIEFEAPPPGAGIYPIDVAASGVYVYVLDYTGNRLLRYDYKGAYLDVLLEFSQFGRMNPVSVTTSGGGRLLTTDARSHRLTVWSPLFEIEIVTGEYGYARGSFNKPSKASFFDDERIAVAEPGNRRVQVLTGAGGYERFLDPDGDASWKTPRYCCDGPEGILFVADTEAGVVHAFSAGMDHLLSIEGGPDGFSPSAVAAGWNDLLYIADLRSGSVIAYRLLFPGD